MWTSRLLHEDIISLFNVSRLAAEFGPSLSRPPSPSALLAMLRLVPGPSSCFSWHLISSSAVLKQHIWTCVPQGDCCLKRYVLPNSCSCLGWAENGLFLTLLNHSEENKITRKMQYYVILCCAMLSMQGHYLRKFWFCEVLSNLKNLFDNKKKNVIESKITTLMREW